MTCVQTNSYIFETINISYRIPETEVKVNHFDKKNSSSRWHIMSIKWELIIIL